MLRRLVVVLLLLPIPATAQESATKQRAVAQMRKIAEAIRECSEEMRYQAPYGVYYWGPPLNLTWDVFPSKTVRSPFQGFVDFTLQHRSVESDAAKHSEKLHEEYVQLTTIEAAYGSSSVRYHLRYEFDLGPESPVLTRILWFDDKTQTFQEADNATNTCWERTAKSAVSNSESEALTTESATSAASNAPSSVYDREDGHWWRSTDEQFRLGFLTGYVSGLNTVTSIADPDGKKYPAMRFGHYTVGQIYEEMDRFYSNPANERIEIQMAIVWVKKKLEGTSQQELQDALQFLRKESSRKQP